MARDTLTGPTPMDVSAVYKGRGKGKGKNCKGKNKNKDKDKDKGSHGEPRCSDHRKGHRKRNCRTFEQGWTQWCKRLDCHPVRLRRPR